MRTTGPYLWILIAVAATLNPPRVRAEVPPYDFSDLDAFLSAAGVFFPNGVGLAVVQDGHVVYFKTFGDFDPAAPIPIASSTKWISGLVVASAMDDGLLALDSRAGDWIPSFGDTPLKRLITVQQAFTHTSGLPSTPAFNQDPSLTLEQAVDQIASVPLLALPGQELNYGGLGMQTAGRMVELAAGQSWAAVASERVLEPAGMDETDYYAFTDPPGTPTLNPNVAGSIRTALQDYTRFMLMLDAGGRLDCDQVIAAEAVEHLFQDYLGPQTPIGNSPYEAYDEFAPGAAQFRTGLGCFIDPARLDPATGAVGWATSAGAFGTNAFIDFDRDFAGVLMTYNTNRWFNSSNAAYNPSSRAFLQYVRPILESIFPVTCGPDVPGDLDDDCTVRAWDWALLIEQLQGPGSTEPPPGSNPLVRTRADRDCDLDVDLLDFAVFQRDFGV